jgi:hypothetical protein
MNREDIVRMAQETGVTAERVRDLVNFASLVASAEREACAKLCDEIAKEDGWEGGYAYRCVEAIRARGQA